MLFFCFNTCLQQFYLIHISKANENPANVAKKFFREKQKSKQEKTKEIEGS